MTRWFEDFDVSFGQLRRWRDWNGEGHEGYARMAYEGIGT